jgi:hypothetical protein
VALDLAGDVAGLGVLVLELADMDGVALALVRPEVLGLLLAVVGDDRVGRVEDGLCRAVVLLELHHLGVRVIPLELQDVPDVGPAEAVDGVVRDQAVRDEVVGVLDVEVVDRGIEPDLLGSLHGVELAVGGEHRGA